MWFVGGGGRNGPKVVNVGGGNSGYWVLRPFTVQKKAFGAKKII
jgi:hypothetical protein